MPELTNKQQAILDYIIEHVGEYGAPPTAREICNRFGYSSPNATWGHLKLMAKKGKIELAGGLGRAIRVKGVRWVMVETRN